MDASQKERSDSDETDPVSEEEQQPGRSSVHAPDDDQRTISLESSDEASDKGESETETIRPPCETTPRRLAHCSQPRRHIFSSEDDSDVEFVATVFGDRKRKRQTTIPQSIQRARGNFSSRRRLIRSQERSGTRSRECMPGTVNCYTHTVVYFDKDIVLKISKIRAIAHLQTLARQLRLYVSGQRLRNTELYYSCTFHFTSSSDLALSLVSRDFARFANDPSGPDGDGGTLDEQTKHDLENEDVNPHLHIVWFRKSRNAEQGIERQIIKWRDELNGPDPTTSHEKVGCLYCLRKYLRKGGGRYMDQERIGDANGRQLLAGQCEIHASDYQPDVSSCELPYREDLEFVDK